jgi:hypothetical protein
VENGAWTGECLKFDLRSFMSWKITLGFDLYLSASFVQRSAKWSLVTVMLGLRNDTSGWSMTAQYHRA